MDTIKLLFINLKISFLRIIQQIKIIPLYFQEPLWRIDLLYLKHYATTNPYKVCKKFFHNEDSSVQHSYGETWPSVVPKFIQYLPITSKDVLFDLGSGTGRISFWFQQISGCQVVAVEKVPLFIKKANSIKKQLGKSKIRFLEKDLLEVDYNPATIIYFYGTSFSDSMILSLLKKWKTLKLGTRVLTTSFHLNEYLDSPEYKVTQTFQVSYPWGLCELFLQEKIK
ncbi:MAG: hypothetical protein S4CHLAM7_04320 [Chlamydiae bacterium]|nr:hypothetical protein [Chlamydiota bacterium]